MDLQVGLKDGFKGAGLANLGLQVLAGGQEMGRRAKVEMECGGGLRGSEIEDGGSGDLEVGDGDASGGRRRKRWSRCPPEKRAEGRGNDGSYLGMVRDCCTRRSGAEVVVAMSIKLFQRNMEKLYTSLMFFSLVLIIPNANSKVIAKDKVTKLHFFVQDRTSGQNQTVYRVAQSDITSTSPTLFGQVNMVDDPITVGPGPQSKILGRAQGMYGFVDLNQIGAHMSVTFIFTSGKHNGSTLSMLGKNNILQKYRQLPIVGGTGDFAMARGIVTTNTYSMDAAGTYAVLEYNIVVHHYYTKETY
ncbi:hypothetical protein BUALT_Bualt15G0013000 [Buddleja alternifolia]|uniref:Dirigent protein n=1 Tax=Buddleja alternifolia TaxID=168488 RepID=A0AAV6WBT5_9LAMI|nr:hypothetical protein BUALT_Bualt15G0013000 [Buddleja alternifolia]